MSYYVTRYQLPVLSWCAVCGRDSLGLWCGVCLTPYVKRGERWQEQPGSNIITVRRAPRKDNGR